VVEEAVVYNSQFELIWGDDKKNLIF